MKKNPIAFALPLLAMVTGAACTPNTPNVSPASVLTAASAASSAATQPEPCKPLETRPPNAREQKPAFAGQTRACGVESDVAFEVTVLARGLNRPWAVEPLPGGDLLITEKTGQMRIVSAKEIGRAHV